MTDKKVYRTRQIVNPLVSKEASWVEVDGAPVAFKGFEAYEFFTYENRWGWYYVVEASTGMSIGDDEPSRRNAILTVKAHLNQVGLERFKAAVEQELERMRQANADKVS